MSYDDYMNMAVNGTDEVKGIPITEKRLVDLGVRKANNQLWISMTNLKAELHFEVFLKETVTIIRSDYADLILDSLRYIHQLQNLYFALTGEELTFNPQPND